MKFDIYLVQKMANMLNKYINFRTKTVDDKWEELFENNGSIAEIKLEGDIKFNLYKDSILCKLIFDGFEESEQLFITRFLKPGDIFLDIGANIGLHSVFAAKILQDNGHVYAFEPSKKTFERLQKSIAINNFADSISAFNAGISDKKEKLMLNESADGHDAWNSFAALNHVNLSNKYEVQTYRIDEFITENNIFSNKISLIKIDVEGWELMVLKGFGNMLIDANFNACFLVEFTEQNTFSAGYSSRELYGYLTALGYAWMSYNETLNTVEEAPLKAYYPYENLIAVKTANLPHLKNRLNKCS